MIVIIITTISDNNEIKDLSPSSVGFRFRNKRNNNINHE